MKTKVASSVGVALCGVLFLTACSGQDSADSQPEEASASEESTAAAGATTAPTEEPAATPEATVVADPPPQVGDCFTPATWFGATIDVTPEDQDGYEQLACTQRTIAVLNLPENLPGTYPRQQELAEKEDSGQSLTASETQEKETFNEAIGPLYDECRVKVREQQGINVDKDPNRATRWGIDVTGPNQAQWDAGQRWARCNITLPGIESLGDDDLLPFGAAPEAATQPWCFLEDENGQPELQDCNVNTRTVERDGSEVTISNGRDSTWVFSHDWMPIGELLDDPGSFPQDDGALAALILPACRELTKSAVLKKYRPLEDEQIRASLDAADDVSLEQAWNTESLTVRCYFPYWAYKA